MVLSFAALLYSGALFNGPKLDTGYEVNIHAHHHLEQGVYADDHWNIRYHNISILVFLANIDGGGRGTREETGG
jgi:hypothetical protein